MMLRVLVVLYLTNLEIYGSRELSSPSLSSSSSSSSSSEEKSASWTLFDATGTDLCTDSRCVAVYEEAVRFQALWTFPGGVDHPALIFDDKKEILFPDGVPLHLCPTDEEDIVWPGQLKFSKRCNYYVDGDSYNFTTPGIAFSPHSPNEFQHGQYEGDISLSFNYTYDEEEQFLYWPTKTVTLISVTDFDQD